VGDVSPTVVSKVEVLGVTLDAELTLELHCGKIVTKWAKSQKPACPLPLQSRTPALDIRFLPPSMPPGRRLRLWLVCNVWQARRKESDGS